MKPEEQQFLDNLDKELWTAANKLGYMKDRVLRDFAEADIAKIAGAFHAWQKGEGYADVEEDAEPFEEKMKRLTSTLFAQFDEGKKLEKAIRKNLAGLGYGE